MHVARDQSWFEKMVSFFRIREILPFLLTLFFCTLQAQESAVEVRNPTNGLEQDSIYIALTESILAQDSLSNKDFQLLNESLFYINYYQSYQARPLYKRSIAKLGEQGMNIEAGILMRWLSDLYYELSFLDSATLYINQAVSIFEEEEAELEYARTANIRRLLLTVNTDFNEALKVCFEALQIFTDYQDEIGQAITFRDIGSIKLQEKKYREALDYCLRSVSPLERVNNWYELTFTYQRLALIYLKLQDEKLALQYADLSIQASKKLKGFRAVQGLFKKYWTKGMVYEEFGHFDQALNYYDSSKYFADKAHFKFIDKWLLNNKGNIYLQQGKYQLALDQFKQAIKFSQQEHIQQNAYDYFNPIYENIIQAYQKLGQYKEANEYLIRLSEAKDSIFQLESEKQVAELETKYETLQKENQIVQLQKDKSTQQTILILGSISLGVLLILAFFLWRNNQYRAKANRLLSKQKEEIRLKNEQNELLLKEIHHRVKNNLEIVSGLLELQSAQISDREIQKAMLASQNRVQAMGILHQKLYQGTNLGSIEMKDYFLNLSEGVLDSFEADQRVKIELAMDNLELDIDTAVPIGLIVNELLTNALKYAFPNNREGAINIALEENGPDELILKVRDNGVGIDPKNQPQGTGFGSQLVSLLTKQLGGSLNREVQNGTLITLTLKKSKAA